MRNSSQSHAKASNAMGPESKENLPRAVNFLCSLYKSHSLPLPREKCLCFPCLFWNMFFCRWFFSIMKAFAVNSNSNNRGSNSNKMESFDRNSTIFGTSWVLFDLYLGCYPLCMCVANNGPYLRWVRKFFETVLPTKCTLLCGYHQFFF